VRHAGRSPGCTGPRSTCRLRSGCLLVGTPAGSRTRSSTSRRTIRPFALSQQIPVNSHASGQALAAANAVIWAEAYWVPRSELEHDLGRQVPTQRDRHGQGVLDQGRRACARRWPSRSPDAKWASMDRGQVQPPLPGPQVRNIADPNTISAHPCPQSALRRVHGVERRRG